MKDCVNGVTIRFNTSDYVSMIHDVDPTAESFDKKRPPSFNHICSDLLQWADPEIFQTVAKMVQITASHCVATLLAEEDKALEAAEEFIDEYEQLAQFVEPLKQENRRFFQPPMQHFINYANMSWEEQQRHRKMTQEDDKKKSNGAGLSAPTG